MPAYRKLLKPAVWGFYIIIGAWTSTARAIVSTWAR